jgi:RHS repeat-associated protein
MTSKTDGTDTTSYTWDEDNRLTLVSLPGGATVAYTYDVDGRMLTRTTSDGTTTFQWAGFDCVREEAPATGTAVFDTGTFDSADEWGSGGVSTYVITNGRLYEMVRDNALFTVVSDALGHVRLVLDSVASTVSSFDYDAWGSALTVTEDLPGGMPYCYVGAYGVRWDPDTGLHYMRNRWYSNEFNRFTSNDPLLSSIYNRYAYVDNMPLALTDVLGLQPCPPNPDLTKFDLFAGVYAEGGTSVGAEVVLGPYVSFTPSTLDVTFGFSYLSGPNFTTGSVLNAGAGGLIDIGAGKSDLYMGGELGEGAASNVFVGMSQSGPYPNAVGRVSKAH